MRSISILALVLACTACQSEPDPMQVAMPPGEAQLAQNEPQLDCRDFTAPLTVGERPEQASTRECQQPDGSRRVVQNTPGLPTQAYVVPPPGEAAAGATTAVQPPANQPPCTSYTVPVTVGGQQEQTVVESCQQPDGSWRITQNTPGLPPQVYVVPPPTEYPYGYPYSDYYTYPFDYPYWAAEPLFFGLGPTIVVARRFPHFHGGFAHGFRGGFAHGFHGGFADGFHGGFADGFHGGFAHGFHGGFAHGFHGGFAHGFHGGFGGGFAAGHGGGRGGGHR
jgi:surface antigen